MKKIVTITFALVVMLTGIASFTSCTGDELDGGLSGWYSTSPEEGSWGGYTERQKVLNFKNKNTVVIYRTVLNGRHWDNEYGGTSTAIPGHSGWYYQTDCEDYQTYVVEENKVYITNGDILTIEDSGDVLRKGSWKFTRW